MSSRLSTVIALLLPVCLWAETAEEIVQRLVADAWSPRPVRVEWKFNGKTPTEFAKHSDWTLGDPHPVRVAGNVILAFVRQDPATTMKVVVTGTAHIFGPCLTVKQAVSAGQPVDVSNLDSLEAEWTYLNSDAAQISEFTTAKVATRALTPGRPITTRDVKGAKLIHRGQTVDVQYADGAVLVRITGRALCDGAVGDQVSVSTEMVASKHLSGTVTKDGTIQLVR